MVATMLPNQREGETPCNGEETCCMHLPRKRGPRRFTGAEMHWPLASSRAKFAFHSASRWSRSPNHSHARQTSGTLRVQAEWMSSRSWVRGLVTLVRGRPAVGGVRRVVTLTLDVSRVLMGSYDPLPNELLNLLLT